MKRFVLELLATMTVSLIAFPCVIIGMGIAGYLYGEKVEPWLDKTFKN